MSEAQEQCTVVEWCEWHRLPIFAIPNGGKRDPKEAAHLKRQGVKAGVPDLFLPIARGGYHGLFIEMKYGTNKVTTKQEEWLKLLKRQGYSTYICYGARNAIACIEAYMGMGRL